MSNLTGRKTVNLTTKEKKEIKKILKSKQPALRVYKRARVLNLISSGYTQAQAASKAAVCLSTSIKICARYRKGGLEEALYDRSRSGQPGKFTDKQKEKMVAMICSKPPKGYNRWTVRVVAEESIRRGLTSQISRETIRLILQSHKLKPWREKNVVYR